MVPYGTCCALAHGTFYINGPCDRVAVEDQSKGLDRIKHDDDAYTFGKATNHNSKVPKHDLGGLLFSDKVEIWTDRDGYPQGWFN